MGYIYSITNLVNGKRYIGQSLSHDIYDRWKSHLKNGSNCRYLKNAFNKYGRKNFKFQVIIICFDSDCDRYEKEYMDRFNTLVPGGYNLREAGNNGLQNEETKNKISRTVKEYYSKMTSNERKRKYGDHQRGEKNHNFGKKWSLEKRQRLSKTMKTAHRNSKNNNTTGLMEANKLRKKKVSCYTKAGDFVATYDSISEAGRIRGCTSGGISACCRGKYKSNKGLVWKFVN